MEHSGQLLGCIDIEGGARHVDRYDLIVRFQQAAGAAISLQGAQSLEVSGRKNRRYANGVVVGGRDGAPWMSASHIEQTLIVVASDEHLISQDDQDCGCSRR